MDNVSLFKRIEGKNLVITTHSKLSDTVNELRNVRINMEGEIMSGMDSVSIDWQLDPSITEIEEDTFEIAQEDATVIITITE